MIPCFLHIIVTSKMAIKNGCATIACLHHGCKRQVEQDTTNLRAIICKDNRCKLWLDDLFEYAAYDSTLDIKRIATDYFIDIRKYENNGKETSEDAMEEFVLSRDSKRRLLHIYHSKNRMRKQVESKQEEVSMEEELVKMQQEFNSQIASLDEECRKTKRQRRPSVSEREMDEDPDIIPAHFEMQIKQGILRYMRDNHGTWEHFSGLLLHIPCFSRYDDAEAMWAQRDNYGE